MMVSTLSEQKANEKEGIMEDKAHRLTDEKLAESDYKAIKYAEGWFSEAEYAPIRAERERIRNEIRELEK